MSAHCKHAGVCRLEAWRSGDDGAEYCILHFPSTRKDGGQFSRTLDTYLKDGRSDFRLMVWPEGYEPPQFSNRHFLEDVNLDGAQLPGLLRFDGCTIERNLIVKVKTLKGIDVSRASVGGNIVIETSSECSMTLDSLPTVHGSTRLSGSYVNARLAASHFVGPVEIVCRTLANLDLSNTVIDTGLRASRIAATRSLVFANAHGLLDWQECTFDGGLTVDGLPLGDVILDLSRSRIAGQLRIAGPSVPSAVICDALAVDGSSVFVAPLGTRRLRLVAKSVSPQLAEATFARVNLSECRLIGNAWDRMTFWDVEWDGEAYGHPDQIQVSAAKLVEVGPTSAVYRPARI